MKLEEIKTYLRVDSLDSDADITALMAAATSYIKQQTGKTKIKVDDTTIADISTDQLYNICVKLMVAHWYENRGVEIAGTLTKISHSVDALVNHISMCGDYI